ncbi:MAG: TetR/AcrR family transcriptional regulator [Solirubrobacterales bacterium]|jgi:AcrR family transcriptional regulator|nr:TetR/AcrR family transcriptional regulator [Solirubrobacterales bacterium]
MSAEPLPRGRHRLSREQVLRSQRGRMLAAMAEAVAEKGYASTSVADVIGRARVSRETFYEQFADKESCFLAAYDAGVDAMLTTLAAAREEQATDDPMARYERRLATYLESLAAEPAFARTFLIEVYAAGPRALERRRAVMDQFVDAVHEVLADALPRGADGRFASEMIVGAVSSLVTTRIGTGDIAALPALREPIMRFARRVCAA